MSGDSSRKYLSSLGGAPSPNPTCHSRSLGMTDKEKTAYCNYFNGELRGDAELKEVLRLSISICRVTKYFADRKSVV